MPAFSNVNFTDGTKLVSKEMQYFMHLFLINTTERIFDYMSRMEIQDTGQLRRSIHGIVYNNAGGNEALVRIYFLNYGRFVEYGLGRNKVYDRYLGGEGIKSRNTKIEPISSFDRENAGPSFDIVGATDRGISMDKAIEPKKHHRPRPFLMRAINAEAFKMSKRLAENFAYTSAVHLARSFVKTMYDEQMKMFVIADARDEQWLRGMKLTMVDNVKSEEELRKELHALMVSKYEVE